MEEAFSWSTVLPPARMTAAPPRKEGDADTAPDAAAERILALLVHFPHSLGDVASLVAARTGTPGRRGTVLHGAIIRFDA